MQRFVTNLTARLLMEVESEGGPTGKQLKPFTVYPIYVYIQYLDSLVGVGVTIPVVTAQQLGLFL